MEMPDEIAGRKVILWALVGSRGCGLATEDSDEDRFALVSPLFEDLYRGNMYHKQTVTLTEDVDVHDVRRLSDLLWKSSPVMLSVLFSPEILVPDTFAAPYIYRILEMRDSIASMNLPRLWSATMDIRRDDVPARTRYRIRGIHDREVRIQHQAGDACPEVPDDPEEIR